MQLRVVVFLNDVEHGLGGRMDTCFCDVSPTEPHLMIRDHGLFLD